MPLSSEQFHTLYDGAAQPVVLVRDGAVAELNCHAQELFTVGKPLHAYLPQDAALPETLYARPAVLPLVADGVCVSANTQPLEDALLLFLPPQEERPCRFWRIREREMKVTMAISTIEIKIVERFAPIQLNMENHSFAFANFGKAQALSVVASL